MIENFPTVAAYYQQLSSGTFVSGRYTPSYDPAIAISIVEPQPLRANELAMLPEGERQLSYKKCWTTQSCLPGDRISRGSKVYKVTQVDDRNEIGAGFYRVVMREIKPDEI